MKSIYCLLFLALGLNISAQSDLDQDKDALKQIIIDCFDEIWSDLKTESIDKFHTEDFLLLENGMVWNNDSIGNYCEKAKMQAVLPLRENSFDFIEIKVEGDMAWIAYQNYAKFSVEGEDRGKAHWLESASAIRTKDGWKLQLLHSTWVNDKK